MTPRLSILTVVAVTGLSAGLAGADENLFRACLLSDRDGNSAAVCACIQDAADLTLTGADQRLASGIFKSPQKADELPRSGRPANKQFWGRYLDFGEIAEAFCG
ncbi:MAG: hypothetical protein ACC619_08695 [Paracoccaceae bacterium]